MRIETVYGPDKIKENEQLLNQYAAEGLYLEQWTSTYMQFSDERKMGYQYRIDVDDGGVFPNRRRCEENEALGYEYVVTSPVGYFHVYRALEGTAELSLNRNLRRRAGLLYRFFHIHYVGLFLINALFLWIIWQEVGRFIALGNFSFLSISTFLEKNIGLYSLGILWSMILVYFDLKWIKKNLDSLSKEPVKEPYIKYGTIEKYMRWGCLILFAIVLIRMIIR